jgi:hypothetical protein
MRRRAHSLPRPGAPARAARWRPLSAVVVVAAVLVAIFAAAAFAFARNAADATAAALASAGRVAAAEAAAAAAALASAGRVAAAEAAAAAATAAALASAGRAAAAEARAASPDEGKDVANKAYVAAEAWRGKLAASLYANMTDADWDTAARWKRYAQPDAPERSCGRAALPPQVLSDILLLRAAAAAAPALTNRSRGAYLALHAFHSTGLEGNTLTLPETLLTISGQPLFAGFDARVVPSRAADSSATEALNVALLWDALALAELPARVVPSFDLARVNVTGLVDMNSAITRGLGVPFGLRTHGVGIGHKLVLLPMPDELPVLVDEFLAWLAASLGAAERATGTGTKAGGAAAQLAALERALALACDAHTRYVFVHPFTDGNGRLARTLSALVLQRFALPAAMVPRAARKEYMAAVSAATIDRDYAPLAALHAAAVRRSFGCLVQLAGGAGARADAAVAAALGRADCALDAAKA